MNIKAQRHRSINKKSEIREWVESIIIALILAVFIRTFIVQPFKIPTSSMVPTLQVGDRILVNKFIYGAKIPFTPLRLPKLREPKRGDIIVFIFPGDSKKDYIKRLIGLPSENLEIREGNIYIDGQLIDDPKIIGRYYYNRDEFGQEDQIINIPEDSYYVLGDNSSSSSDSRVWGFVPEENVLGKAFLIFFPPKRIRLIK